MNNLLTMIIAIHARLTSAADNERGATATEYALLVALIALVIVGGVTLFGGQLNTLFSSIGSTLGTTF